MTAEVFEAEVVDGGGAEKDVFREAQVRRGEFDFLVTDWNMPGMQGIELLKAIRTNEKLAKLPG